MYKHDIKAKEPQKSIKRNVLVQSLQQFDAEMSGRHLIIYATHRELVHLMILCLKIYRLVCSAQNRIRAAWCKGLSQLINEAWMQHKEFVGQL